MRHFHGLESVKICVALSISHNALASFEGLKTYLLPVAEGVYVIDEAVAEPAVELRDLS